MGHLKKEELEGNEGARKAITCHRENGMQRWAKVQNLFAYSWTQFQRSAKITWGNMMTDLMVFNILQFTLFTSIWVSFASPALENLDCL